MTIRGSTKKIHYFNYMGKVRRWGAERIIDQPPYPNLIFATVDANPRKVSQRPHWKQLSGFEHVAHTDGVVEGAYKVCFVIASYLGSF